MGPGELIKASGDSPIVVWAIIILGLMGMVSTAVPKLFGPLSKTLADMAERYRRNAAEREDVAIQDLRGQVEFLRKTLSEVRQELNEFSRRWHRRERRWRIEKRIHDAWDYKAQQALLGHEPPFDVAPEYMTPDPADEPQGVITTESDPRT